jgi:hypothetical protein
MWYLEGTLKTEEACSSETSTSIYQITRRHSQEHGNVHSPWREKIWSQKEKRELSKTDDTESVVKQLTCYVCSIIFALRLKLASLMGNLNHSYVMSKRCKNTKRLAIFC